MPISQPDPDGPSLKLSSLVMLDFVKLTIKTDRHNTASCQLNTQTYRIMLSHNFPPLVLNRLMVFPL